MKNKYMMPDSLFASKPRPGAIVRDWTEKDFTLTVEVLQQPIHFSTVILHSERNIKTKGKAAKLGKGGYLRMVLPCG